MQRRFLDCLSQIPHDDRQIRKGALLFERSDPVQQVFVVRTGKIHLIRRKLDGDAFILQRATPGSLVAEASLMTDDYHCAAQATEESVVSVWPIDPVRSLIHADREASRAFVLMLAAEVRRARLHAEILSLRKVSERLDAWLVWNGDEMPDKGSWRHIANEINVSQEALYRELARRRMQEGAHSHSRT